MKTPVKSKVISKKFSPISNRRTPAPLQRGPSKSIPRPIATKRTENPIIGYIKDRLNPGRPKIVPGSTKATSTLDNPKPTKPEVKGTATSTKPFVPTYAGKKGYQPKIFGGPGWGGS